MESVPMADVQVVRNGYFGEQSVQIPLSTRMLVNDKDVLRAAATAGVRIRLVLASDPVQVRAVSR